MSPTSRGPTLLPLRVGGEFRPPSYDRDVPPHAERTPRAVRPVEPAGPKKKGITPGAWEEARNLVWKHRKRLAFGLFLMLVNRLAGLVLPTTTKYLMDDVITKGHWDLLPKLAFAAGAATLVDAGDRLCKLAGPRRRRAAGDHRDAQGRRGARHAPADRLLRFDEDRHPDLADHDRRRRHPESGRHRTGAADRIDSHGGHRAWRAPLSQLEIDDWSRSSSWARSAA